MMIGLVANGQRLMAQTLSGSPRFGYRANTTLETQPGAEPHLFIRSDEGPRGSQRLGYRFQCRLPVSPGLSA